MAPKVTALRLTSLGIVTESMSLNSLRNKETNASKFFLGGDFLDHALGRCLRTHLCSGCLFQLLAGDEKINISGSLSLYEHHEHMRACAHTHTLSGCISGHLAFD